MNKPKSKEYIDKLNAGVNPCTKLDESKVRQIKHLLEEGACVHNIAEHFGVSTRTVRHIKAGTRWSHVH